MTPARPHLDLTGTTGPTGKVTLPVTTDPRPHLSDKARLERVISKLVWSEALLCRFCFAKMPHHEKGCYAHKVIRET